MQRGWGESRLLSKWYQEKQLTVGKIKKLDPYLTPHTKEYVASMSDIKLETATEGNDFVA